MSGVNAIADVYRAVIADVINQMKESFLDENIDADILSQLKKEWEDKVMSSGCVDLNPPNHMIPQQQVQVQQRQQQNIAPPPIRPNPQMIQQQQQRIPAQPQNPPQNVVAAAALQQQLRLAAIGAGNAANDQHTLRNLYTQQPGVQPQQALGNMQLHHQTQIRAQFPQQQQQQPQFLINSHNFQPGQVIMVQQPNGTQVPMSINNLTGAGQQIRILPQNPTNSSGNSTGNPQLSHMNQLDGNFEILTENSEKPSRSEPMLVGKNAKKFGKLAKNARKMKVRGEGASEKEALEVLGGILHQLQLDGGGGGMSDSSSDEDEDDPLRRIADRIGDGDVEDGEQQENEEEPLNSEDDQSDDEDLTVLFDADNIIMCQFEKVHRARTKWKFQLKDGVMHVDKKDYVFQKCSGEAEW